MKRHDAALQPVKAVELMLLAWLLQNELSDASGQAQWWVVRAGSDPWPFERHQALSRLLQTHFAALDDCFSARQQVILAEALTGLLSGRLDLPVAMAAWVVTAQKRLLEMIEQQGHASPPARGDHLMQWLKEVQR